MRGTPTTPLTRATASLHVLAASFAARHDFDRGYGPATNRMLRLIREGGDWRTLSAEPFEGAGSWGNGAGMRVAPLGAWLAGDLAEVVRQAALSALVTHANPEAVAGAVAVAVATAVVAAGPGISPGPTEWRRRCEPLPHWAGAPPLAS
ncbi:ADP-ribosylglycohydrolase family protein [Spongiactinospora sp. TRM90649]|uniref:ADP-ribosylglycohydrolase family protein n=1 Tax=Spongiactinospora sp. TRM90649 TaxID=3031114 RepID=UPI003211A62C